MDETTTGDMKVLVAGTVKSQLSDIQMLPEPQRGYASKHFVDTVVRRPREAGYQQK